jgi:hypothetical protein
MRIYIQESDNYFIIMSILGDKERAVIDTITRGIYIIKARDFNQNKICSKAY